MPDKGTSNQIALLFMWQKEKKREKLNRSNLQRRLKRAQQPGAGLGGRAYGLLNRKDGMQ